MYGVAASFLSIEVVTSFVASERMLKTALHLRCPFNRFLGLLIMCSTLFAYFCCIFWDFYICILFWVGIHFWETGAQCRFAISVIGLLSVPVCLYSAAGAPLRLLLYWAFLFELRLKIFTFILGRVVVWRSLYENVRHKIGVQQHFRTFVRCAQRGCDEEVVMVMVFHMTGCWTW